MLRISAISAGAVEYLVRGSGCTDHKHAVDLDEGVGQTAERSAGMGIEGGQGPAYFEAAVSHGEPAGRWFGTGLEAMGINARSGEAVDVDDVRAVFGQLRRPESSEEVPEFLGRRPPTYKTEEQRLAALVAKEPGEPSPERLRELELAAATDGRKGVAYYDFTFSAPKSVSVYWAALQAAGAHEQAAAVAGAHDRAVEIAIAYADKHVAYTRTGWHGRTTTGNESVGKHEAGQGTVWTLWRHSTSRENEPQLHTHGALLNRTVTADGKIGALDGRSFRAYKEAFASAYERALEQLTTEATGARFAERADGVAREIVGVDPELMAEASTRRGQVTARVQELVAAYVERNGHEPGPAARKAMADMATLDTRAPKGTESGPAGVAAWGAARVERLVDLVDEVAAAGHDAADVVTTPGHAATAARAGQELGTGPVAGGRPVVAGEVVAGVDRAAVMAAAVSDVQAQYSVWTIGNLTHALDRRLGDAHELGVPAEARPALLEALAREALASTGVVQVSAPDPVAVPAELQRADGGSIYRRANGERYATVEHLAMEDHLVTMTRAQTAPAIAGPQLEMLRVELAAAGLSSDQVEAVAGIVSSGRAGDVLVGPAGAGKSHTVGALARVWGEATGGRVIGVATSQVATQNLAGTGLEAINTTRFLNAFTPDPVTGQVRDRLGPQDLVVIDEAGMSSTPEMHAIAALVSAAGGKVVPTGDAGQLQAVGAGGMFAHLARANGAHELREVHRFTEGWEAQASLQMRAGDHTAIDAYSDHGRLRTGRLEEMQEAASRGYLADTLAGKQSLLIVGTNRHAAELSHSIRQRLVDLGRVAPQPVAWLGVDRQEVSVGDSVQARMNDYRLRVDPAIGEDGRSGPALPVTNREVYTVIGLDPATGDLLVRDRFGATAHLPGEYVREHVSLAYAVTGHAAQGVTVDTAHPIVDRDTTREALYPAATRGRESNTLYLVTEREPDAHAPERIAESARERLAAVLDNSAAQQAATFALDRGVADAESLTMAAGQWDAVAGEYARARYSEHLTELLGPERAQEVHAEAGYGRLLRSVREAEMGGHNAETVLAEAVTARRLENAASVSDVLRWRVRNAAEQRAPEQAVDPRDWTTLGAPLDGAVGEYAQALAVLASDRQEILARQVAEAGPEWATAHLGPAPDADQSPQGRAEWERRAGIAAAYRELHSIPAEQVSLGAAPSREYEFHRALWSQARDALGQPADVTDHQALPDGDLWAMTERWAREQAAAPDWVADELAEAYQAAHEHRIAAQIAGAELAALPDGDARHDDLVAERDTAERLAGWNADRAGELEGIYEARREWAAATSDVATDARLAAEELDRRGLPAHRERAGGPAPAVSEPAVAEPDAVPAIDREPEAVPVEPAEMEEGLAVAVEPERAAAVDEAVTAEPARTEDVVLERTTAYVRDYGAVAESDAAAEPAQVQDEQDLVVAAEPERGSEVEAVEATPADDVDAAEEMAPAAARADERAAVAEVVHEPEQDVAASAGSDDAIPPPADREAPVVDDGPAPDAEPEPVEVVVEPEESAAALRAAAAASAERDAHRRGVEAAREQAQAAEQAREAAQAAEVVETERARRDVPELDQHSGPDQGIEQDLDYDQGLGL